MKREAELSTAVPKMKEGLGIGYNQVYPGYEASA